MNKSAIILIIFAIIMGVLAEILLFSFSDIRNGPYRFLLGRAVAVAIVVIILIILSISVRIRNKIKKL